MPRERRAKQQRRAEIIWRPGEKLIPVLEAILDDPQCCTRYDKETLEKLETILRMLRDLEKRGFFRPS
jgi:hypothetical protein